MPEDAIHQRLKRKRGKALGLPCLACGGPAVEWAYQHGGDPEDLEGYSPMCRSCHRKLDYSMGTPVPSTLARATTEDRRKGQAAALKTRKKRGCVVYIPHGYTRWRASLQHQGIRVNEHYVTREEAEVALERMKQEAGLR